MKLNQFQAGLAEAPDAEMKRILPGGTQVQPHAHVTEVARINKGFADSGGKFREESLWRLHTWVAEDFEHRPTAGKLRPSIAMRRRQSAQVTLILRRSTRRG